MLVVKVLLNANKAVTGDACSCGYSSDKPTMLCIVRWDLCRGDRCWGLVLSLLVGCVLLGLAGIHTEWTLNAGESPRIEAPILLRNSVGSSTDSQLDAVVFYLNN